MHVQFVTKEAYFAKHVVLYSIHKITYFVKKQLIIRVLFILVFRGLVQNCF